MRLPLAAALVLSTLGFAQRRSDSPPMICPCLSALMPGGAGSSEGLPRPSVHSELFGWRLEGESYEFRCDELTENCEASILRSRALSALTSPGQVVHRESAAPWRGVKVALRVQLRTGGADDASLVLRVEDASGRVLTSASAPAVKGTTLFAWHRAELVVPEEAERLVVGIQLKGGGAVFIRQLHLDDVELLASAD
jgi:hypothetical protein